MNVTSQSHREATFSPCLRTFPSASFLPPGPLSQALSPGLSLPSPGSSACSPLSSIRLSALAPPFCLGLHVFAFLCFPPFSPSPALSVSRSHLQQLRASSRLCAHLSPLLGLSPLSTTVNPGHTLSCLFLCWPPSVFSSALLCFHHSLRPRLPLSGILSVLAQVSAPYGGLDLCSPLSPSCPPPHLRLVSISPCLSPNTLCTSGGSPSRGSRGSRKPARDCAGRAVTQELCQQSFH